MLDETYEKRIELQANRIAELEQENASYFKQAQFYIVEKERAEAQVEKFHQGFILQQAEAERLTKLFYNDDGSMRLTPDMEMQAKATSATWDKLEAEERAEKAEADLKEQTRLGLACHDELAELKAKYQESEDGSEMVDAENDPTNQRKGSDE